MRLKCTELVNFILFVLLILGLALLILSGYLITQCGYTYSVRLVQLLCRCHGVARSGPTHSGNLITQCGFTYSVRLVQLLCRSMVLLGRALLTLAI
jgi:hypothetical protein